MTFWYDTFLSQHQTKDKGDREAKWFQQYEVVKAYPFNNGHFAVCILSLQSTFFPYLIIFLKLIFEIVWYNIILDETLVSYVLLSMKKYSDIKIRFIKLRAIKLWQYG